MSQNQLIPNYHQNKTEHQKKMHYSSKKYIILIKAGVKKKFKCKISYK